MKSRIQAVDCQPVFSLASVVTVLAISRKLKGSKNRTKAVKKLAKQQHKLAQRRDGYDWQIAKVVVDTADVVARVDLNIPNMVKRAKPKHDGKGGYKRNNAAQKTGLNKVILDASWGDIFDLPPRRGGL